jgi:LacI family transcriptional regulator
VFAVADVVAVGAMAAIRNAGLVPGRDIAVAGFDDIQMLQDVTPSLTTVALPLAEIGARSLELALADNPDASLTAPIEGRVVVRDSTPPRRAD